MKKKIVELKYILPLTFYVQQKIQTTSVIRIRIIIDNLY